MRMTALLSQYLSCLVKLTTMVIYFWIHSRLGFVLQNWFSPPASHFVSVGKWKRDDVHNLNPEWILIWKTNMIYWLYPGLRHLLNLASGTFPHIGSFLQSPCLFSAPFCLLSGVWFFAGLQKQIRQKAATFVYFISQRVFFHRSVKI